MELFPLRLCVLPSKISGSSARVRKLRYMTLTISEEMVDRSFYPTFHLRVYKVIIFKEINQIFKQQD